MTIPQDTRPVYTKHSWDVSKLLVPSIRERFEKRIADKLDISWRRGRNLNDQWLYVCQVACDAAYEFCKRQEQPRNSNMQAAYTDMRRHLMLVTRARLNDRNADYNASTDSLQASRQRYLTTVQESKMKRFKELISDMEQSTHLGERIQMAFRYLKPARRRLNASKAPLTLRDWHRDSQSAQGDSVQLITVSDFFPMLKLPSANDVSDRLARMKNGKTPGSDLLAVEMFKASATLCDALYGTICEAYRTCQVPDSWQTTVSQPIPKKTQAKTIGDFRKITLCSVGYKVHAALLQQQIEPFLPQLDDYQSGFIPNRSCDDLIFVMKNLLDTRWNHGLSTYVLSLDLEKAFDTVKIDCLPGILMQHGVPHYLINLLIVSCLHEQNCVYWMGEKTSTVNKSRGIKQGCPISPYLFNVILDSVITKLKVKLAAKNQELCTGEREKALQLPLCLAYADDTSFLGESLTQLGQILTDFISPG